MANSVNAAIAAYNAALRQTEAPGIGGQDKFDGPSFGDVLKQSRDDAISVGHEDEKQTMAATVGQANLADVVTAVSAAERTVQTVTAVRDKVIAAYQEVLRMPI